jgi:5-oxoprolinase (ATP-hydrolysing)
MQPIELIVPEGMLNPRFVDDPRKCPAVVAGNVELSQRIVDVIFGALGIAAASQGTMNNLIFGNDRFGYYETICGGAGATSDSDGASCVHTHMTNTRITDVEIIERRYPVRVRHFARRWRSGGSGAKCGGDGVVREIEMLEALEVSLLTQRRSVAPFGMNGGQPGNSGRNTITKGGDEAELGSLAQFTADAGDILTIRTPGGGGFGPVCS